MPKTPLDYRNEVVTRLPLDKLQALARPRELSPLQQELVSWHQRLYHLPYRTLFRLTTTGFLHKQLLECRNKPPLCVACQFVQYHRCTWHTEGKKIGSIQTPAQKDPGNVISVDQIVSAQPGLIPKMSGFPTNQRLWGCTTFVYHVSDYVYVHLMRYLSLSGTLLAKTSMEKIMSQSGQTVNQYLANNGRFADNGFVDTINEKNQNIKLCGEGAHHQNGIIENKNKVVLELSSSMALEFGPKLLMKSFGHFPSKLCPKG